MHIHILIYLLQLPSRLSVLFDLPLHETKLQTCVSLLGPSQGRPSGSGTGSSHSRLRDWTPPSQVSVQEDHALHEPYAPFTETDPVMSYCTVYTLQYRPHKKSCIYLQNYNPISVSSITYIKR